MFKRSITIIFNLIISALMFFSLLSVPVFAEAKTEMPGNLYTFDEKNDYKFSESKKSKETAEKNTYGKFSIEGNVKDITEQDGVSSYLVSDGSLKIYYNYGNELLNADVDSWHLVSDKAKKIDSYSVGSKIKNGAILVQTSKNRKSWVTETTILNAFSDVETRTDAIYTTKEPELLNGCYYRIIVAYKLSRRTEESNFLLFNTDKYENKRYAEVYEFYAYNTEKDNEVDETQSYALGKTVKCKEFDGYYGGSAAKSGDLGYNIDLGQFYMNGFTSTTKDSDGNIVFLKTPNDKLELTFKLEEDIDKLNGDDSLSITADDDGMDEYFQTSKQDFGRGTLIIRHINYKLDKNDTIYSNYLEANATVGADTKVKTLEEGDYEVALDYQITKDQLLDKVEHYRTYFKFSVRNGNCMAYPIDLKTGSELQNSSITENGFRLDLVKSRYLKVYVKRETMKEGADGLVEDTRYNGPAEDGAEYTEEGVYTISVENEYTNQSTSKKIYVGSNKILKAYATTGLSISEINELVKKGAKISDDGTITIKE